MSLRPALFIGRFQPFHIGHLDALHQICEAEKKAEIIIVIGSSESEESLENPFSLEERREMVEAGTKNINAQISIIPVPDINNYHKWVEHVKGLVPAFGRVYTGSPIVSELFSKAREKVVVLNKNRAVSATEIRNLMASGNPWQQLVPPSVVTILERMNAVDRIKKLSNASL
ncbi:nicotinamide-nucleotide adenylyltransferase [Candidatus Gracilibacteria bacterium]|nr:nicotinamide-nucleotide adenylyltransferase [Candidatus Gracilibacteria bacterium]